MVGIDEFRGRFHLINSLKDTIDCVVASEVRRRKVVGTGIVEQDDALIHSTFLSIPLA